MSASSAVQPPHGAVRPDGSIEDREIGTTLHRLLDRFEHGRAILGMNALDVRLEGSPKRAGLKAVMGFDRLRPPERPRRVVHVPDPDVGTLQRKPHALFADTQGLGTSVPLDTERNVIGHGPERRRDSVRQRMTSEEGHDTDDTPLDNQRMPGSSVASRQPATIMPGE